MIESNRGVGLIIIIIITIFILFSVEIVFHFKRFFVLNSPESLLGVVVEVGEQGTGPEPQQVLHQHLTLSAEMLVMNGLLLLNGQVGLILPHLGGRNAANDGA